jgi:DNA (cytosine-5)-methyltransferase 1
MKDVFNFVDIFAGIGGFHLGCAKQGGKCIGACEINEGAREIYKANFGILPHSDVRTLEPIKGIDLLCAGFPCQSHSTIGLRKGFRDPRGKLFDVLCEYIKKTTPKAFLLENVKGLLSSSHGKSFKHIIESLIGLGYKIAYAVLDSQNFNLPQHRERIFIVGSKTVDFDFERLLSFKKQKLLKEVLDSKLGKEELDSLRYDLFKSTDMFDEPVKTKKGFVLRAQLGKFTRKKLFSTDGIVGTITTKTPPPIYDEKRKLVRHLSKNELKKCQGFPASFKFANNASRWVVVDYIGNAVSVNVISHIVSEIKRQGLLN